MGNGLELWQDPQHCLSSFLSIFQVLICQNRTFSHISNDTIQLAVKIDSFHT